MVRGYIICRQMQKVVSMRERRMKEKKLLILQASVCILRAFQKWVKRSRARRRVYMLREVRAALQGDERTKREHMLNASAVSFSNGIRVARAAISRPRGGAASHPREQIAVPPCSCPFPEWGDTSGNLTICFIFGYWLRSTAVYSSTSLLRFSRSW
jgi:hypothetical protein